MEWHVRQQDLESVLKRIFWLAWQACNHPFRMGVFQDKSDATEDDVWSNVLSSGDYPGAHDKDIKEILTIGGTIRADYVFGRMMKLTVEVVDPTTFRVSDYPPRQDYQGWTHEYVTYDRLVTRAGKLLGVTLRIGKETTNVRES